MFGSLKNKDDLDDDLFVVSKEEKPQPVESEYQQTSDSEKRSENYERVGNLFDFKDEDTGPDAEIQPSIIDVGTFLMRCGFIGDDAPRAVFPTICGRWNKEWKNRDFFVGDEAQAKRGVLDISCPMDHGLVNNWNDFEKIVHHIFYNELRITPEEHPCYMTEPLFVEKKYREKMTSIFFETFNVPAFYLVNRSRCAMVASGRTTGLCCRIGHTVSTCLPLVEGQRLEYAAIKTKIGGREINEYLNKCLSESGYEMTSDNERSIVQDIKENLGYVAYDYESELVNGKTSAHCEAEYELPDGSKMTIGRERFRCTEILFKPLLISREENGFHESIYRSIMNCEVNVRKDMFQNIVLAGGSTMFEGIVERVSDEVQKLGPRHSRIKVNAPAERKYSSWIGGSIEGSLGGFQKMWITKEEYDEVGPSIIHKKCP